MYILSSESLASVPSRPQNWRDCPPLYIFFSLNIVHLVRRISDNCNLSTEIMGLVAPELEALLVIGLGIPPL